MINKNLDNYKITINEIFCALALKLGKATAFGGNGLVVNDTNFETIKKVLLENEYIFQLDDEPEEEEGTMNWFGYDKEDDYFYIVVLPTDKKSEFTIEVREG